MADLCKHHELILQYAEDAQKYAEPWKLWELSRDGREWTTMDGHPIWFNGFEYRRKPRTIRIGEYDVPEPMRAEPNKGDRYYVPCIDEPEHYVSDTWDGYRTDKLCFSRGLIHSTPEAAELHGRALASLTSDA